MGELSSKPTITTSDPTGIYQETHFSVDVETHDLSALKEVWAMAQAAFKPRSMTDILAHYEAWAADIAQDEQQPDYIQKDAKDVVFRVSCVRQAIAAGEASQAAYHGMHLGKNIEGLEIRVGGHEKNAMQGRKNKKSVKGAAETRRKKANVEYKRIRDFIKLRQQKYPDADEKAHSQAALRELNDKGIERISGDDSLSKEKLLRALGKKK